MASPDKTKAKKPTLEWEMFMKVASVDKNLQGIDWKYPTFKANF